MRDYVDLKDLYYTLLAEAVRSDSLPSTGGALNLDRMSTGELEALLIPQPAPEPRAVTRTIMADGKIIYSWRESL